MGNVRTTFTSDDREIQKALDAMTRQMQKLREENAKLRGESKRSSDEFKLGAESALGAIGRMAAGYLTVQAALQAVNTELERKRRLEKEAADAQVDYATAEQQLLNNLATATREETRQALDAVGRISRQEGIAPAQVALALSNAVSARGNLPVESAIQAVELSSRVAGLDAGSSQVLAGAILDAAAATGQTDAQQNLGYILGIAANARLTDLGGVGRNLVPATAALRSFGDDPRQAAALAAAATFPFGDASGEKTRTAIINFGQDLQKFLPELGSTAERIALLQNDEAQREKFLKGATFEAFAAEPLKNLLRDRQSSFAQNFARLLREPGLVPENAAANAAELIAKQSGSAAIAAARSRGALQSFETLGQLGNVEGGRAGVLREQLFQTLEQSGGLGPLDRFGLNYVLAQSDILDLLGIGGEGVESIFQGEVGRRIRQLRNPTVEGTVRPRAPTAQETETANRLEELQQQLLDINRQQLEAQRTTEQNPRRPVAVGDGGER